MSAPSPDSSPLLPSADPASLDLLFSADPLDLTPTDLTTLVAELRRRRMASLAEDAQAKPRAPKTKLSATIPPSLRDKPLEEIDLGDLT